MPDLLKILIDGGWMMIPLVACSLAAFAVLFERGWAFYKHSRIDRRSLRSRVLKLLEEDRVDEAAWLCADTPSPVSAVLLAGIQAYKRHRPLTSSVRELTDVMEKAMDDYAQHAMSAVEKRLYVLSTVGSTAPLLGMLGTVLGMIMSFEELGLAGGMGADNAAKVAKGIAVALITTGVGLFIALCAVIPYNWLTSRADAIELEIEEAMADLLDHVAVRVEAHAARSAAVRHGGAWSAGGGGRLHPGGMRAGGRATLRKPANGQARVS